MMTGTLILTSFDVKLVKARRASTRQEPRLKADTHQLDFDELRNDVACPSRESLSWRATAKLDTVLIDAPPNTQQRPDLQQAGGRRGGGGELSHGHALPPRARKRKVTNIRMVVSKLHSLKSILTPPSTVDRAPSLRGDWGAGWVRSCGLWETRGGGASDVSCDRYQAPS